MEKKYLCKFIFSLLYQALIIPTKRFTFCIIDVWQDMPVKFIVTAAQLKYKHTPQAAPPFKDLPVESFLIFNI